MVFDGVTGLLVPPKDLGSLASSIMYLLENNEISKSMGHAGRKRVGSDFSLVSYINQMQAIYSRASR